MKLNALETMDAKVREIRQALTRTSSDVATFRGELAARDDAGCARVVETHNSLVEAEKLIDQARKLLFAVQGG